MSRRANNNARVSKRKGSRKGSKRVSRKGKKGSRKGTKKRGMLARLMGKMKRGKRSSRKSKGRNNNNNVAVLVPVKGGQRGGGKGTIDPTKGDTTFSNYTNHAGGITKEDFEKVKGVYKSTGDQMQLPPNGTVKDSTTGKLHNVWILNKTALEQRQTNDQIDFVAGANAGDFFPTAAAT